MIESDLRTRFPLAFNDQRPPLKVGISSDLGLKSHSAVLERWTKHPVYLRGVLSGAARLDLNGVPAGRVTDRERDRAWFMLWLLRSDAYANRRLAGGYCVPRSTRTYPGEPPEIKAELRRHMPEPKRERRHG